MSSPASSPTPEDLLPHADHLRSLARRLVRDSATAEDLLQETWLAVLEKPARGVSAVRPWLAGVVRNLARERSRGEGRRSRREALSVRSDAVPSPGELVERVETFRDLAREVVALDEPYRSTIILRFFQGLSAGEIAQRLSIPPATVRSRQKRALEHLRARLDRRHGGDRSAWHAALLPIALGDARRLAAPAATIATWIAGITVVGAAAIVLLRASVGGNARAPSTALAAAPAAERAASRIDSADPSRPGTADRAALVAPPTEVAAIPAARRGPLRLTLVDKLTGEPVPRFQVEVRGADDRSEALESDARGRIDSSLEFVEGALSLYLIDHPELARFRERPQKRRVLKWRVNVDHRVRATQTPVPVEPELRILVGPTYPVHFLGDGTPPVSELEAALRPTDVSVPDLESVAPLREDPDGGLPWVRFLSEATAFSGPAPWPLEVRSRDGFARGSAQVAEKSGRVARPVEIELHATGVLEIDARDENGAPLAASFELRGAGGATTTAADLVERRLVRWVAPGPCTLRVAAPGHAARELAVAIEPGRRTETTIALTRLPSAGRVAGRIVTRTGLYQGEIAVHLVDLERGTRHSVTAEVLGAEGAQEARFLFDAVPPGEYEVSATSNWVYRWTPTRVLVRPPAEDVLITGLDAGPETDVVFRAVDARTHERLEHFQALLEVDPEPGETRVHVPRSTYFAAIFFGRIPAEARVRWVLTAEGYVPARGDERTLAPRGAGNEMEVLLERGWERDVEVRDARSGAPIPGARVIVDGVEAGATGKDGALRVRRESTPRAIRVHYEGGNPAGEWAVLDGIDPVRGTWVTTDLTRIVVRMAPR